MILLKKKWITLWATSMLVLAPNVALSERLAFNDKDAPESLDDLREIQAALQRHLERARAATVCLQVNGGSGSAVIISEDGLVLTAAHVTAKVGQEMTVVMEDGRELKGVALGLNSETDSAMLQIKDEGPFPFVDIDEGDTTILGDWVFSLGHSGGFDKERGINVRVGRLVRTDESTVQSDCILIGGDSGGPLFNMAGELIGIHSRVGGSREESMHVPLREFQAHWDALKASEFLGEGGFAKKVVPGSGFLGLKTEDAEESGLTVKEVWEGSCADEAGIEVGDRITKIAGEDANSELMAKTLAELGESDSFEMEWLHEGESKKETLTLGKRP